MPQCESWCPIHRSSTILRRFDRILEGMAFHVFEMMHAGNRTANPRARRRIGRTRRPTRARRRRRVLATAKAGGLPMRGIGLR